jgi:hypothetical protein
VPEGKVVKNRMHLDLTPTRIAVTKKSSACSASARVFVEDRRRPDGTGWVVMADPEGMLIPAEA